MVIRTKEDWIEAELNDVLGKLTQSQLCEVVAELTQDEFERLQTNIEDFNGEAVVYVLRRAIKRQWRPVVEASAEAGFRDYQEDIRALARERERK
jgi:hypothetical protein